MKFENQVCSQDLARKLRLLGVKQESLFYWLTSIHHDDEIIMSNKLLNEKAYPVKQYSAFTVAELGIFLHWAKLAIFGYPDDLLNFVNGIDSEADARAKMLIHLIENKLIDPKLGFEEVANENNSHK